MKKLNVEILKLARDSRLITQKDLAKAISIEQGTLSKFEKGIYNAEPELVEKMAKVLNYPVNFFYQEKKVVPVEGHYRRRISISEKKKNQHIALMTFAEWRFTATLSEIELPDVNLPSWDIIKDGSAAVCAKYIREFWKIPKGRITDVTKFIEDNGVIIIALNIEELDGFSTFFNGSIPIIFVNKNLPTDRYRLTICHELGHLIMHFGNKISADRDLEEEAYEFAIELLVPETNIRPYLTKVTIEKLADLKGYWFVSMGALLKYANTLGMVTGSQYRYLWTQMGALGFKKNEPVRIPNEKPELTNEIIDAYINELGYTKVELSNIFYLTIEEFEDIYFNSKLKLRIV